MLPGAHPDIRGPRARVHRQDRHPVPQQPVRRGRLPRRDARDDDRVGDDPAPVGADPAVRRLPRLGPEPARAADRPAVELLDRRDRRDDRQHARVADRLRHRGVRRPAVPRALRQVPADPPARDRAGRSTSSPSHGAATVVHRPAAADRPDLHQLPGRCRPDAARPVHRLLDGGRLPVVDRCWSTPGPSSARTGSGHPPRPPAVRPAHRGRRRCSRSSCSSGGGSGCPGRPRGVSAGDAAGCDRDAPPVAATFRNSRYSSRSYTIFRPPAR